MRLILALVTAMLLLPLASCAAPPDEEELIGRGSPTPQGAVESFLDSLNSALGDPNLADPATRRGWAERLAAYFAPSERADQRAAMGAMLAAFIDSASRPVVGSQVRLEISYSSIELISRQGDEALVRVVDGVITLRWLDETGEVVRERRSGLTELIGQESGGLPVLRVGSSWYMTEG
ncbi:MAG: hypothetical protein OHK0015_14640 [Chloroflexi bacterium OHK40]